ncbi:hypothetical protein K474DRAFT_1592834, partial [Panus rudis PR-1116 ss-1]
SLRTDIQYDVATNTMVAILEVPGLSKDDLTLTLRSCPFSRIRHLTVSGLRQPPEGTWAFREQKYGNFGRTIVVPPDTKPQDIRAELRNGILTLTVKGSSAAIDDPTEIPIME